MKKFLLFLTLMVCGVLSYAYDFSAVAPTGQTLYYTINGTAVKVTYPGDYTYTYAGYIAPTGFLIIPEIVIHNGSTYSVTSIGNYAFKGCSSLTSVTIPNSVTSIGSEAFYGCCGLVSVTIGNSVSDIGYETFYDCSNVDTLYYNARNLTTNANWYNNKASLYGFYSMRHLKVLLIGDSVQTIPPGAFYAQEQLTSVTIPNSVTSIGEYAFYGCSNVDTLYYNARNLSTNSLWCNSSSSGFRSMRLRHLVVGNSVETLPMGVFYGQTRLTSVGIPNSVTSIGQNAFDGCSGLACVSLGDSVTRIEGGAFYNCTGLTRMDIPNSVTSIGQYAFSNCTGIISVTVPNSVTSIGKYAFSGCRGLTGVTIGDSVTDIESCAFLNCSGLTSITIGKSVNFIGESVFSGCSNLDTLYYNAKNLITTSNWYISSSSYDSYGFRPIKFHYLEIGDSVETLPIGIFYGQNNLTSITIGCSLTTIREDAFFGCSNVDTMYYNARNMSTTSCWYNSSSNYYDSYGFRPMRLHHLIVGDSVETLPMGVFYGQDRLVNIVIGNSVTNIESNAFEGCGALTTIYSKNTIAPTLGTLCFYNCPIQRIYIPCGSWNSYYSLWLNYRDYLQEPIAPFTRNLYGADTIMGYVELLTFECADTSTIQATANYGYHFTQWNDGVTDNPRTFVLTQDTAFTAEFGYNTYMVAKSCDIIQGMVEGVVEADYLTNVTLTATANYGYHFTQWNDGVIDNPRTFVLTQDTAFTAEFGYNQYVVAGMSTNGTMGEVSGTDTVDYLQTVTLTATANYGYHFTQWSDGDTNNPRTFVLTQDTVFMAEFGYNTYMVAKSCDTIQGMVEGVAEADYLSNVTLTAIANYGYHFTQWNDGVIDNPRTFVLTQDTAFTAEFGYNQYVVTCMSTNEMMGEVSGSDTVDYLLTVTLTATANYGYHFTQWSDGDTDNPRTFVLTQDTVFTAEFDKNRYVISGISDNELWGTVVGSGDYLYLDTVVLMAAAVDHYRFAQWQDGSTENPRAVVVSGDATFTAYFEAIPVNASITVVSANETMGTVTGAGTYVIGTSTVITATANNGYRFVMWNDGNTETIRLITVAGDATYTAYFEALQGIDDIETIWSITAGQGCVVVEGAINEMVRVLDVTGRLIETASATSERYEISVPQTGVYFVQVGSYPARKVVVVK